MLQWNNQLGKLNIVDGVTIIPEGHELMTDFIVRKYREHQYIIFLTRYHSGQYEYTTLNYVSYDGEIFDINTRNLGNDGRIRRYSHQHHLPLFNCFENIQGNQM